MRSVKAPVIAGFVAGVGLLALFGVYSMYSPDVQSSQSRLETYNLVIDNRTYLVQYQFQDEQARVLSMAGTSSGHDLNVTVQVPNATVLEVHLPNATVTAVFSSICYGCRPTSIANLKDAPLVVFVDDIETKVSWNYSKTEAIVRIPLEAGSDSVEFAGTYME